MDETRTEAIRLAMQAVGRGTYSMDHHDHAYLYQACTKSGLEHCTATDCSGFVSYIFRTFGRIDHTMATTELKNLAAFSYGDSSSVNWENVYPGDAVVCVGDRSASENGIAHALLYIGTTDRELKLSIGTIPAGCRITVDCLKLNEVTISNSEGTSTFGESGSYKAGNIYLRWGSPGNPLLYSAQSGYMVGGGMADGNRLYIVRLK